MDSVSAPDSPPGGFLTPYLDLTSAEICNASVSRVSDSISTSVSGLNASCTFLGLSAATSFNEIYLFRECCSHCRFQQYDSPLYIFQNYFLLQSKVTRPTQGTGTASSSASWSRFSPPSNFVNGHVSTMWFMVCRWRWFGETPFVEVSMTWDSWSTMK